MAPVRQDEIERGFREHYGRAVAVLVRRFGDIDLAEEPVQEGARSPVHGGADLGAQSPRPLVLARSADTG